MVEMELVGVRVELPNNAPIVLLRESAGEHRLLPIFIGGPEAMAIAYAHEGVETPRPMTHDLLKVILDKLEVEVQHVVVTELRDSTFFAEIHLLANGQQQVISCRPSDAIALAVRAGKPIYVDETVLDDAGYASEEREQEESATEQEEVVAQFREFIDTVNPEDFAS